jgi:hypothetical protein
MSNNSKDTGNQSYNQILFGADGFHINGFKMMLLKLIYPEKQNNLMPLQTRNTIHDNDYIISHFTPKYYVKSLSIWLSKIIFIRYKRHPFS